MSASDAKSSAPITNSQISLQILSPSSGGLGSDAGGALGNGPTKSHRWDVLVLACCC